MKFRNSLAGLLLFSPAVLSGLHAESNDALLKRIEELEAQVKVLSRKAELTEQSAEEHAKASPIVSLGSTGFQARSADTNFVLKIRGYLQADSRWYFDHSAANDTFLLRRVRPILEGTVFGNFDYRLMLDFGAGITTSAANNGLVQDAYMTARFWPEFQVQAGKFKEPVGLERLRSGSNLQFVERAYPSQLLPNRDVGVQVQGDLFDGRLTYAAGLFNGVGDGNSGDIDGADPDKDVAARVFVEPFKNSEMEGLQGLGFGVAGTYGERSGSLRSYNSPGQQAIFSYYSGTGAAASTAGDGAQWRISPQAYYYWRSLGILGEYAISTSELRRTGGGVAAPVTAQLQHTAWQVALSYFLTGEDNAFKAVAPRKPFGLGGAGWGAWEIAGRVSQLKLDEQTFPLFANPATSAREAISYTAGLNWYLNRNVKMNFNFEHSEFSGGDLNPAAAHDENTFLTRAQLSF